MKITKPKITTGLIFGAVGGILTILATILPWASVPGVGIYSRDVMGVVTGFGTIVLIIGILGLIFTLLSRGFLTIICGMLSLLITLFWYGALSFITSWFVVVGDTSSMGYGTYIALVGAPLLIVGGILISEENKTE